MESDRQFAETAVLCFTSVRSGLNPVGTDRGDEPLPVYLPTHMVPEAEQSFPENATQVYLLLTVFERFPQSETRPRKRNCSGGVVGCRDTEV